MNFNIFPYQSISIDNIQLGQPFAYGDNYDMINLYIHQHQTNTIYLPKSNFIVQTPIMFIPQNLVFFNDRPFLSLSFMNQENDELNSEFKEWVHQLETDCYELLKKVKTKKGNKLKKLNIKKKNLNSIIKRDLYSGQDKIVLPINLNTSKCVMTHNGLKEKDHYLCDWNIASPTYGFCIIGFKNIWVKDGKWGINTFCYLTKVMPSHLLNPIETVEDHNYLDVLKNVFTPHITIHKTPDTFGNSEYSNRGDININTSIIESSLIDNKNMCGIQDNCTNQISTNHVKEEDKVEIINDIEAYTNYFKLKKMRVPIMAIKNKMEMEGFQSNIIDYSDCVFNAICQSKISGKYYKMNKQKNSQGKKSKVSESIRDVSNEYTANTTESSFMRQNTMSKYEQCRPDIGGFKLNFLNDIKGNGVKLNRVSSKMNNKGNNEKSNITHSNSQSSRDSRVPSLNQIQEALQHLNQTDINLC